MESNPKKLKIHLLLSKLTSRKDRRCNRIFIEYIHKASEQHILFTIFQGTNLRPPTTPVKNFITTFAFMDFSQTRLKLRVAVCPFSMLGGGFESVHHQRVVGVKRSVNESSSLVILRQFLLLPPLDCTFSDLQSLVLTQYEKLYKQQSGYTRITSLTVFRDSNHCDLDLDYLVSDICASNDLIYAMVELEDPNKKTKNDSNTESSAKITEVVSVEKKTTAPSVPVKPVKKNEAAVEKKGSDSAPAVVAATGKKLTAAEKKKQQQQQHQSQVKPLVNEAIKPVEPVKIPEPLPVKIPSETKLEAQPIKPIEQVLISKSVTEPVQLTKSVPVTEPIQTAKPVPIIEPVQTNKPVPVIKPVQITKSAPVIIPTTTATSNSNAASTSTATTTAAIVEKTTPDVITPSPTPIPRPVFNPRKPLPNFALKSSSSDDSSTDDETGGSVSASKPFDVSNLFGTPIITSEPRRNDSFILFDAGSSSSDDSEEEILPITMKTHASSIVSLQAAPSSDLDNQSDSSSSDEDLEKTNNLVDDNHLPQSVTQRRLNSVSPIPDSSEIPSLEELKESLSRAPTPIQKLQQNFAHNNKKKNAMNNNSNNNNNTGRPMKKPNGGRPKKPQQPKRPQQHQNQNQKQLQQQKQPQQVESSVPISPTTSTSTTDNVVKDVNSTTTITTAPAIQSQ
jgi:hypothetical protein